VKKGPWTMELGLHIALLEKRHSEDSKKSEKNIDVDNVKLYHR
jgi:hypothetical protein